MNPLVGKPFAGMSRTHSDASTGERRPTETEYCANLHAGFPGFGLGVMLDTSEGPQPVEWLRAGDLVLTRDHGYQPLLWVGRSRRNDPDMPAPLRIHAGALGKRMPERDLVLSPGHHVLLRSPQVELHFATNEVLAPVSDVANEAEMDFDPANPDYAYRHLMFPQHELVLVEGVWCESLFPDTDILKKLPSGASEEITTLLDDQIETLKRARMTLTPGEACVLQPRYAVAARRMAA